jgi:hypothetical protein
LAFELSCLRVGCCEYAYCRRIVAIVVKIEKIREEVMDKKKPGLLPTLGRGDANTQLLPATPRSFFVYPLAPKDYYVNLGLGSLNICMIST